MTNYRSYIKEIGLNIFISKVIRKLCYKNYGALSWKINSFNEEKINRYLENEFKNVDHDKYTYTKKKANIKEPIWVMWYQGVENAPDIVKMCINSIKIHAGKREVYIITEKNITDFIDIPDYVLDKVKIGAISRTHLSDIIRLMLLLTYGGAWLDATIYVECDIPDDLFNQELYSINFGTLTKDPSHGRWTTFLLFAKPENYLIKQTLDYHLHYWSHHDVMIDYIMVDYIINYVINHDSECKKMMEKIPRSNASVFKLGLHLNDIYTGWKAIGLDNETIFYKLSWKVKYQESIHNKQTVYGWLIQNYLKNQSI